MSDSGIRTKTFVAPAVDGPLAGRLIRAFQDVVTYAVPKGPGRYRRVEKPDGSTIWQHEGGAS